MKVWATDQKLCDNKFMWCFHKIIIWLVITMQAHKEVDIYIMLSCYLMYFLGIK